MGSRRRSNFGTKEARQLTISFLHVSQDPITGVGQKAGRFWDRVGSHFNSHKPSDCPEERSPKSLETKWNQIKKETTRFCGIFSAIDALSESGTTFEIKVEKSLALYKGKHPKLEDFAWLDCWYILREIPRWADMHALMKKTTPLIDITNGNDVPVQQSFGPTTPMDSPSPGGLSPEEEQVFRRPPGSKKAKDGLKRQKIIDESILSQARATSELTATICEKVALMKEQALVALFSLKDEDGKISPEGKEFFQLKRSRELAKFKKDLEREAQAFHEADARPIATPATRSPPLPANEEFSLPTATRTSIFGDDLPSDEGEGTDVMGEY